ncbi:small-subunit processome [Circinella umbellata]|nr:small-subunit processome [Circinella umbellata]
MPPQRKGKNNNNKNNNKRKNISSFNVKDVFEADDDDRSLKRKGHDLDDVDDYEYDAEKGVASEDDEEIESDDAFNDSDEERFEHFKFSGSNKDKKSKHEKEEDEDELSEQEINMDESDNGSDDEEEEDGEGFMDISAMLDNGSDNEQSSHKDALKALLQQESDSESEDEALALSNDEDDDDNDAMDDVKFIESLETKKRKRDETEMTKKRQRQQERTEVYEENEFNLIARGAGDDTDVNKKKLDLNDLMDTMDTEGTFTSMRKSLLELDGKGKNVVKSALDAPAAKRIQDRADRQAAYKEANKEVGRWEGTVNEIRQAEHLHFPLLNQADHKAASTKKNITSATLASKFSAQTTMEQQIEQALSQAGMKDEELEEFEALQLNKLSVDEVQKRRQELQMMRELMFRSEIKAKRLKKIKSKSYRKLQRKEKARQELQAAGIGHEVDHDMDADEQMKAAMSRAEERMSLKHKNTSQWAKRALARGQQDEGTREAILDQLKRGEELRKKVQGIDSGSDSDYSSDDEEDENRKDDITNDLEKLQNEMDEEAQDTQTQKGLLGMKFMQEAEKKKMAATKAMVDDFQTEWLNEDQEDKEKGETNNGIGKSIQNNPGRLTFGTVKSKMSGSSTTPKSDIKINMNDAGQIKKVSHSAAHTTRTSGTVETKNKSALDAELDDNDNEVSPWLQQVESRVKGKKASKKHNTTKGKIEDKAELNIEKIKKSRKGAEEKPEDIELDLSQTLSMKDKKTSTASLAGGDTLTTKGEEEEKPQQQKPSNKKKQDVSTVTASQLSDDDNEDYSSDDGMIHSSNKMAFQQKELVARAFANDNVTQEFELEKATTVKEQGDQTEDLTLPGWGSWGGKGMKKKKNKIVKTNKGVDPLKRKDAKLKNVIINEKRNKKIERYEITQVPFPFQTMEQYERSLRAPVGKEWNTRDTFQKVTKPRIITKLGTVINPLDAPFK